MGDPRILEFANSHGGVVTAEVLAAAGVTRGRLRSRVRAGWQSVGRGAYRILPVRDNIDAVRAAIAVLPRAVASHESAAELHGFPRVSRGRSIVTVHSRTTHLFESVDVRRCHDLQATHITHVEGLRTTTIARTVVDLAAHLHPKHLGAIVDDLHLARRLDLAEVRAVAGSVARKGKPGTVTMRTILLERVGDARPQSELERRGRRLLRDAGLETISEFAVPWAPHRRFDDAFPAERLAIEWDSRRFHGQLDAFDLDRRRDRDSIEHGWRILRFTWTDVVDRPAATVATVRRVVDCQPSVG